MSVTKPIALDETLQRVAVALEGMGNGGTNRVSSLTNNQIILGNSLEVVGIPVYVDDVTDYSAYSITDTGWYVFARIQAKPGIYVVSGTTITGAAGYIKTVGNTYVDVAIKFGVAAESQTVTVSWETLETDVFVFKATDLAVRNLDYRTTFYVYDIAPFTTWSYAVTADATFAAAKKYYTRSGDTYTLAEVTEGDTVPTVYYEHSYVLTTDTTFVDGKTYYTESGGVYSETTVTAGDPVTPDTYYVDQYDPTTDSTFDGNKTYYTKDGTTYTAATVTGGETVPTIYYNHSKVTFSGMTRNITYELDETIDCPSEFVLPAIEDDGHGCWFEIRLRHSGSFSSTLVPLDSEVKVATEHTQAETAGLNMIDLHYMNIDGVKLWRFMNTHSTIPA